MTVAFGTVATGSGRSTTITAPAAPGATTGTRVRVAVMWQTTATMTAPAGWTQAFRGQAGTTASTGNAGLAVYWRDLDGSSADTFTATLSTTVSWQAHSNTVTGTDPAAPVGPASTNAPSTALTNTLVVPGLTSTRPGRLSLTVAQAFPLTPITGSVTPPAGMTETADTIEATTPRLLMASATEAYAANTTTGTRTAVSSVTASQVVADGVLTSGSTALSSASAAFRAEDVGKTITSTNLPGGTTIVSVTSATAVVLSQAATASGTAQSFTIVSRALSSSYVGALLLWQEVEPNRPPVPSAGSDQTVAPGQTVTLTGTATDPDAGDTVSSYAWTQTLGPTVTLSGSGATRTFVAPGVVGGVTLRFALVATDNNGNTSTADTAEVYVESIAFRRVAAGGVWVNRALRFARSGTWQ